MPLTRMPNETDAALVYRCGYETAQWYLTDGRDTWCHERETLEAPEHRIAWEQMPGDYTALVNAGIDNPSDHTGEYIDGWDSALAAANDA